MCVHTCMFVCVRACVNVCGAQKTTLPVIPRVLSPCWLRQGLSLAYNPQAGKADWPVSLRGCLSPSPHSWDYKRGPPRLAFSYVSWGLNSFPHTCRTRALLTEPCPQAQEALLEASGQLLRTRPSQQCAFTVPAAGGRQGDGPVGKGIA